MRRLLLPFIIVLGVSAGAEAYSAQPAITNPTWLRTPKPEDLSRVYPANAKGLEARVVLDCIVTQRGLLDNCKVVSETPANHGFGDASLLLAPSFLIIPALEDGRPVGGAEVRIPIHFMPQFASPTFGMHPPPPRYNVVANVPWEATPTAAAVAAAFPSNKIGKVSIGHVVLLCRVSGGGALTGCEISSEEPAGDSFAAAAESLIKDFKVSNDPDVLKQAGGAYTSIPFDFRDPSKPAPPVEVVHPDWLVTPDPKMAGRLFPEEAARAGYKTGVGTIDCQVTHGGRLANCTVSSEAPPGFGFGKAALAVSNVMVMNPWTQQGDPVDGARISLPIRVNLGAEPPVVPAPRP